MDSRKTRTECYAPRWPLAHNLPTFHRLPPRVTLKSRSSATPFGGLSRTPARAFPTSSPATASGLMATRGGTPP